MRPLKAGVIFIISAIILGALCAHALKDLLTPKRLNAFKTGVNYLMYSGIGLLALEALRSRFSERGFRIGTLTLILGTLLFSGSIFMLCFLNHFEYLTLNVILGPSTPIGGVLMIVAWIILFVNISKTSCTKDT